MMKRFFASLMAAFALLGATQAHATITISRGEIKEILTTAHTDYIEGIKKLSRRDPCDQRARLKLSSKLLETLKELQKHYPSIVEEFAEVFYGEDLKILICEDTLKNCKVNLIINQFGLIEFEVYSNFKLLFMSEI